jgi:hypothetical protein
MPMTIDVAERSNPSPTGTEAAQAPTRRRLMVGFTGVAVAIALIGLGSVLRSNAAFAEQNVAKQMAEQRINFKPAEALTPEERGTPCLVRYAGQLLTTGAQAECYANHFIGHHLKKVAEGKTYSEMRAVQTDLRERLGRAQAAGDPTVGDLQRELAEVNGKRQTLFEGETVRGLLLTSYGFGTLGTKADQGATVAFAASAAVLILSLVALGWTRIRS